MLKRSDAYHTVGGEWSAAERRSSVPPLVPCSNVVARRVRHAMESRLGVPAHATPNRLRNTGRVPEGVDDECQEDYLSHGLFTLW
jgi:hypothetical protein